MTPRDELEARLTALLLGELPADEAAALCQQLEEDADLRLLHDRLAQTIGLVRKAAIVAPDLDPLASPDAPRLSAERREKLLASFKVVPIRPPSKFARWRQAHGRECAALAAMLVALLIVAAVLTTNSVIVRYARPQAYYDDGRGFLSTLLNGDVGMQERTGRRKAVTASLDGTDAELAADAALERSKATYLARVRDWNAPASAPNAGHVQTLTTTVADEAPAITPQVPSINGAFADAASRSSVQPTEMASEAKEPNIAARRTVIALPTWDDQPAGAQDREFDGRNSQLADSQSQWFGNNAVQSESGLFRGDQSGRDIEERSRRNDPAEHASVSVAPSGNRRSGGMGGGAGPGNVALGFDAIQNPPAAHGGFAFHTPADGKSASINDLAANEFGGEVAAVSPSTPPAAGKPADAPSPVAKTEGWEQNRNIAVESKDWVTMDARVLDGGMKHLNGVVTANPAPAPAQPVPATPLPTPAPPPASLPVVADGFQTKNDEPSLAQGTITNGWGSPMRNSFADATAATVQGPSSASFAVAEPSDLKYAWKVNGRFNPLLTGAYSQAPAQSKTFGEASQSERFDAPDKVQDFDADGTKAAFGLKPEGNITVGGDFTQVAQAAGEVTSIRKRVDIALPQGERGEGLEKLQVATGPISPVVINEIQSHPPADPATGLPAESVGKPAMRMNGVRTESEGLVEQKAKAAEEFTQLQTLYSSLTNASRDDVRRTLATATPDSELGRLLVEQNVAEQQLKNLSAKLAQGQGVDQAELEKLRGKLDISNRQFDNRVDGILNGLKLKIETTEGKSADRLAAGRSPEIDRLTKELESLHYVRDRLAVKISQDTVDAKLARSSIVEVVENADANVADKATLGQKVRGFFDDSVTRTAKIAVEKDMTDIGGIGEQRTPSQFDPYWTQTQIEKIQSKELLGKVATKLNLGEAWAKEHGGGQNLKTEDTVKLLQKKLDVRQDAKTGLLDIRAKSDSAEEASRIANAVAEVYQAERVARWREMSTNGLRVLQRELDLQNQKIAALKQELERRGRLVPSPQADVPLPKLAAGAPVPQPEVSAAENFFSTFSLNVSDVSFKLAAASLEKGQMPEAASVRTEEFINAFDYRDPEPGGSAPIAFAWERARYPFAHDRDLVRFSVKTAASGRQPGRPLNLVLAIDNSGSMERADRVRILRECLRVLGGQLQPQDRVSVVAFARTARLVVDGFSGKDAANLPQVVGQLAPDGGTNLEDAMNLAYQSARRHYLSNGVNRVVLLTDGAANLGDVEPASLKAKVEAHRQQGIALDCFGIGWEGFNDDLLEQLSRNGDGRYGFVNSTEAARSEFAAQLAGALKVAASDVKVQVEWNPRRVTAWRQIGYAKHQLKKEQFRDNTVDAAEIGAAEAGNALYTVQVNPAGEGPLGTVRVRFKVPGTSDYREHESPLPYAGAAKALEQSSPALRLAASASAFSEWLVSSPFAAEVTPDKLLGYLGGVPEAWGVDARPKKLEWMLRQAKSVAGR